MMMNEQNSRRWPRLLPVILVLAAAVALGIYVFRPTDGKLDAQLPASGAGSVGSGLKSFATGSLTAFVVKADRKPAANIQFQDGSGKALHLADWRGRVVLVNLWATWCAPCRKEMPSLAALQSKLGSKDFEVLAISVDRKGAEASSAFLKETGADSLTLYVDPTTDALNEMQALGLPATFLIDRQGREIGRLLGPAEWNSEDAVKLVQAAVAEASPSQ